MYGKSPNQVSLGERRQQGLLLSLARAELEPTPLGLAISVAADRAEALRKELLRLAHSPPPDPMELALYVKQRAFEKFDAFLGKEMLTLAFARERLDVRNLPRIAEQLLVGLG